MSEIDRKLLRDCAALCKILCSEGELDVLQDNLRSVLHYFDRLKKVNTSGIRRCTHVSETPSNVVREDDASEHLSREAFLNNSPSHVGGMISVPPVIDV